jgi:hypothetical protein
MMKKQLLKSLLLMSRKFLLKMPVMLEMKK